MSHVLIIDDEQSICWGLTRLAHQMGHSADSAGSAEQGILAARQRRPDLIILDVRLPGMDGLTALETFYEQLGSVPVIVITAYGQLETAVEAIRRGAFEYIVKPFDLSLAERTIRRALTVQVPPNSPQISEDSLIAAPPQNRIIGQSPAMHAVYKQIALVAPTDACVHIWGESGTGKELVARAIHRYSRRADGPFIPVNLAALNPSVAESELFGHVRGAFTGAEQTHQGFLEQAHGGTIFLDEVAEIPLTLQVKLLRALEHGEIWRVGDEQPSHSDFRLITATHQDLRQRVSEGLFRHDLYFRLVTFLIEIPPLRKRPDDIPLLAEYFADLLSIKNRTPKPRLSVDLLEEIKNRPWYGNVRELRNAIEYAMILARGSLLTPSNLPLPAPALVNDGRKSSESLSSLVHHWAHSSLTEDSQAGDLYARFLALVEPPFLSTVLQSHQGRVSSAARQLGLHRATITKKLHQYGILGQDQNDT